MNIYIVWDICEFGDDFLLLKLQLGFRYHLLRQERRSPWMMDFTNSDGTVIQKGLDHKKLCNPIFFNVRGQKTIIQKILNIGSTIMNGKCLILGIIVTHYPEDQPIDMFLVFLKLLDPQKTLLDRDKLNGLLLRHWGNPTTDLKILLARRTQPRRPKEMGLNLALQSVLYQLGADIYAI